MGRSTGGRPVPTVWWEKGEVAIRVVSDGGEGTRFVGFVRRETVDGAGNVMGLNRRNRTPGGSHELPQPPIRPFPDPASPDTPWMPSRLHDLRRHGMVDPGKNDERS